MCLDRGFHQFASLELEFQCGKSDISREQLNKSADWSRPDDRTRQINEHELSVILSGMNRRKVILWPLKPPKSPPRLFGPKNALEALSNMFANSYCPMAKLSGRLRGSPLDASNHFGRQRTRTAAGLDCNARKSVKADCSRSNS